MMNPKMILQLKTMLTKFRQNHPKVPLFFSAASKAINEGSVIEISLTTAEGRELCTNMRVTQDDLEMIRTLGEMASKIKAIPHKDCATAASSNFSSY